MTNVLQFCVIIPLNLKKKTSSNNGTGGGVSWGSTWTTSQIKNILYHPIIILVFFFFIGHFIQCEIEESISKMLLYRNESWQLFMWRMYSWPIPENMRHFNNQPCRFNQTAYKINLGYFLSVVKANIDTDT